MFVGVNDNIYTRGTILIYGLKYALPGDKYHLRKSLCGKFPGIARRNESEDRKGSIVWLVDLPDCLEVIIRNEW